LMKALDSCSWMMFVFVGFLLTQSGEAANPKIIGFAKVDKNIYRGGRPRSDLHMRMLAKKGIRTVINLQGRAFKLFLGERDYVIQESEQSAKRAGLRYFNIPFTTAENFKESDEANALAVARAMNDPQLQPVYVHCNVGADRSGIAVAAYRILYQGCSFRQSRKEMYEAGKFWTPLFTLPQMSFLQEISENQRKYSGTIRQKCPLPPLD